MSRVHGCSFSLPLLQPGRQAAHPDIPKNPTMPPSPPPRNKCKFPIPVEYGLGFFSLGIGCRLKTWLGGGKCCGSLPLFCWILFGIDFGSVGSFKTLQLLIDKNHLGSFSSSGVGPSRRSQRLQSETVLGIFFFFFSFGRVGWFLFWGFFSSFVVLLRDITQNGIGIPEADANRGGLGAIPHSHREFRPFPILPSVIRVLPGIPSTLLYPSLSHFGWSFPSFFWGEFRRFNPKSIRGQFGFVLLSHPLLPWASSRIPAESKGQNSMPYL